MGLVVLHIQYPRSRGAPGSSTSCGHCRARSSRRLRASSSSVRSAPARWWSAG